MANRAIIGDSPRRSIAKARSGRSGSVLPGERVAARLRDGGMARLRAAPQEVAPVEGRLRDELLHDRGRDRILRRADTSTLSRRAKEAARPRALSTRTSTSARPVATSAR
jgi:hypothetical protein